LLTAVLTAGWFPPYIWSDIGWYLSFLAFAGVLIVAPVITQRLKGNKEPKILAVVLIETISAQIMTLPIILFIFGRLSLVAIVSNMLIVPLVPVAMALSFIAGISAMLVPTLAGWIAWPAVLLLTYILDVVQVLADLPHASIDQKINVYQLIVAYMLVLVVVLIWWHKVSPDVKIKKLTSRNIDAKLVQ
jgi:competence protein ComEC